MALRVLLADESSTIKKVMQLALQDFGVEVKAVPIGLDVALVAKSFQPDIIFADVMLAKKSGYEVSAELKNNPELTHIPIILMWSGFMDIDEPKAQSSRADRRLEKPFDAEHLRSMVKDLVPRLKENSISSYLSFPDLPEIVETPRQESVVAKPPMPPPPPPPARQLPAEPPPRMASTPSADLPLVELEAEDPDESDDFQQVPLPGSKTRSVLDTPLAASEENWRQGGLEQFRVAPEALTLEEISDEEIDLSSTSLALSDGHDNISLDQLEDLSELGPATKTSHFSQNWQSHQNENQGPMDSSHAMQSLDPVRAEEILRQTAREVLESIAWKIIPDMTERIVREELQKLMREAERLS